MSLYNRHQTRRSLLDTIPLRTASQLATALGYVVFVRGMTKEDFGVFNLLYSVIPVVSTVASLGLEQTLRRFQPEYLQAGRFEAASWLVSFVGSARFAVNVAILAAILFGWNQVSPIFKVSAYRAEFAVFCLLIVTHFQVRVLQIALSGHMSQRHSIGSLAVAAFIKLIGYSSLTWSDSLTLDRAILTDLMAYMIAYLQLRIAYRRVVAPHARVASRLPAGTERQRLLRFALLNNFNDAGALVLSSKSDNFFIAAILDPIAVGVYGFYVRLNEMSRQLLPVRLFDNVFKPLIFALPATEADRRLPRYFTFLLNMNLSVQWPILAYATAYHVELVQVIFGGKFVESSWLLPIVVGFSAINAVSVPATVIAQYEEKSAVLLLSKVVIIYNVASLLLFLPIMGVLGAVLSTGTSETIKNLYIWWKVRGRAKWINGPRAILAGGVLWAGAVGLCLLAKSVVTLGDLANLVLGMVILAAALGIHFRGPAISTSDRAILKAMFTGREACLLRAAGLFGRSASE